MELKQQKSNEFISKMSDNENRPLHFLTIIFFLKRRVLKGGNQ
jgi:hypothetical protein